MVIAFAVHNFGRGGVTSDFMGQSAYVYHEIMQRAMKLEVIKTEIVL